MVLPSDTKPGWASTFGPASSRASLPSGVNHWTVVVPTGPRERVVTLTKGASQRVLTRPLTSPGRFRGSGGGTAGAARAVSTSQAPEATISRASIFTASPRQAPPRPVASGRNRPSRSRSLPRCSPAGNEFGQGQAPADTYRVDFSFRTFLATVE